MKIEPITNSSEPNVLIHNVLLNCGYVESSRHATLICENVNGFSDAEEALIHLHKTFKKAFEEACKEYNYYKPVEPRYPGQDLEQWIFEYCISDNDKSPGGYEPWEVMCAHGWEIPGKLTTGMAILIEEKAEMVLSTEKSIKDHIKAFNGVYIPRGPNDIWPLTTDLRMFVLTVGEVERKPLKHFTKK